MRRLGLRFKQVGNFDPLNVTIVLVKCEGLIPQRFQLLAYFYIPRKTPKKILAD